MADYEDNKQKDSFTLFNNETGKSYDLPVIKGTDGPDVLDIRKDIDELWGCSGGSIIGGYYAYGIPPLLIEKICFNFYNERHEEFIIKGDLFKSFKTFPMTFGFLSIR